MTHISGYMYYLNTRRIYQDICITWTQDVYIRIYVLPEHMTRISEYMNYLNTGRNCQDILPEHRTHISGHMYYLNTWRVYQNIWITWTQDAYIRIYYLNTGRIWVLSFRFNICNDCSTRVIYLEKLMFSSPGSCKDISTLSFHIQPFSSYEGSLGKKCFQGPRVKC